MSVKMNLNINQYVCSRKIFSILMMKNIFDINI